VQLKRIAESATPYVGIFFGRDEATRRVEVVRDASQIHSVGTFCSIQRIVEHQKNAQVAFNAHRRYATRARALLWCWCVYRTGMC
jgi:hypothetical protein